jgi:hypothetical protein
MTPEQFRRCRHPRQAARFWLAIFFSVLATLIAIALIVFSFGLVLLYVGLIVLAVWITLNIFYATFLANAVKVTDRNYPRLQSILDEMRTRVGLGKPVEMFVYQQGEFNAYFRRFFARRAIFLNSELLETGVTDDELRWLIGRFVGQVKARHRLGVLTWMISLAERVLIFNVFIYPYVRATAYTGDRLALACIDGDISTATSAMNKLLVGRGIGYTIDPAGLNEQNRLVKASFFAFLARLFNPLPHTLPRYADLIGFASRRFPTRFQQFAAENPAFQHMAGSGSSSGRADAGAAVDLDAPWL